MCSSRVIGEVCSPMTLPVTSISCVVVVSYRITYRDNLRFVGFSLFLKLYMRTKSPEKKIL